MSTLGTDATQQLENFIGFLENAIFVDAFSAGDVQNTLGAIRTLEIIGRNTSNPSVSEKKDFYNRNFDDWEQTLTQIKSVLEAPALSGNSSVSSLLKRCKECEQEIHKIRNVILNF